MTGSAYALTLTIPNAGFKVTAGEPVVGGLHGATRHMHCPYCLSWVFTQPGEMKFINLRATMLDDARWFAPYIEVFAAEKLPWADTGATHSFNTHPDLDAYGPLIEAFAREGARPA